MKMGNETKTIWPKVGNNIITDDGLEYTIGPLLSKGGSFGILFEGYDVFNNEVAIKIFKPAKRKFSDVRRQWERETDILERVKHQNVVFIHDAFICDNLFYIVFERAWGNLFDLVQKVGPLAEPAVKEIARQILFALSYIHRKGILHKDLTVYNILYFPHGKQGKGFYKVSDFGISQEFTESWNHENKVAHRLFKPPELVKYGYTTMQSDLYHLGLVLYFCLKGEFPYKINLPQNVIDKAIMDGVPRKKAEQLNAELGDFISVLLRRRESYRYQNEIDAWQDLRNIIR